MPLTLQQLSTLKTAILADPALAALPSTPDGAFEIARQFNLAASPDFWVWKSRVTEEEIMQNGFDWVQVDNLTVGKARIWEWFFKSTGAIDPSKANVRAGIIECWSGTAQRVAVQAVVFGHCQRRATRAEKLFATGAGTSVSNGTGPATMSFEGNLSYQDVEQARNS